MVSTSSVSESRGLSVKRSLSCGGGYSKLMGLANFIKRRWAAHNDRLMNRELYQEEVFGDHEHGEQAGSGWNPNTMQVDAGVIPGQPASRESGPQ